MNPSTVLRSLKCSCWLQEEDRGAESLTDNDPDTFWESDGSQGNHWIRMQMKSETVIKYVNTCIQSVSWSVGQVDVLAGENIYISIIIQGRK